MRRGRSQTWSQVQRFPSASELWFIMKKFQGERAESKPEVTERRARASQPPLLSPLTSLLSALSLHLYLVCGSVTFTLLSLLRPLRTQGSKRRMSAANSEWNPKTQQEHEGDWLSPHHVKTKNTGGDTVLCFCGCLDFGN